MSLSNYKLNECTSVYDVVNFEYNRTDKTSNITVLLNLPNKELRMLETIDLPFTDYEPSQKYSAPIFTFRDYDSVFINRRLYDRIYLFGEVSCMPPNTRYAYQCEYDEFLYEMGCNDRSGYIVWKAVKEYVEKME